MATVIKPCSQAPDRFDQERWCGEGSREHGVCFCLSIMRQRHGDQQARVDSSCGEVREKIDYEVVVFRGGYTMRIDVSAGWMTVQAFE